MRFDKARHCSKCGGSARYAYQSWPNGNDIREWMARICLDCGFTWREYLSEEDDVRANGAAGLTA